MARASGVPSSRLMGQYRPYVAQSQFSPGSRECFKFLSVCVVPILVHRTRGRIPTAFRLWHTSVSALGILTNSVLTHIIQPLRQAPSGTTPHHQASRPVLGSVSGASCDIDSVTLGTIFLSPQIPQELENCPALPIIVRPHWQSEYSRASTRIDGNHSASGALWTASARHHL